MKVVLANTNTNEIKVIETNDLELETLYGLCKCDTIEIPERKFGRKFYDIVCDGEGLLRMPRKKVAILTYNQYDMVAEQIVGNCVICRHNRKGDLIGLTDEECEEVLRNAFTDFYGHKLLKARI